MATETILLSIPAILDVTNPPGIGIANSLPILLFDDSTAEICYWQFRMPRNFSSNLVIKHQYSMASATSGTVEIETSVWAISDGDAVDVDTESYDTVNNGTVTVPGTAGYLDEISTSLLNADSLTGGDLVRIRSSRDADDGVNDTATGDLELRAVSLEYTTT